MRMAEAQAEIDRLKGEVAIRDRKLAWAEGRRADGVDRAPGFTIAETRVLRTLAGIGQINYDQIDALQRHMSNIRKRLREMGAPVTIQTEVEVGYVLTSGKPWLEALLMGQRPQLLAPPQPKYLPTPRIPTRKVNPYIASFLGRRDKAIVSPERVKAIFQSIRNAIVPDASCVAMAM